MNALIFSTRNKRRKRRITNKLQFMNLIVCMVQNNQLTTLKGGILISTVGSMMFRYLKAKSLESINFNLIQQTDSVSKRIFQAEHSISLKHLKRWELHHKYRKIYFLKMRKRKIKEVFISWMPNLHSLM